VFTFWAAKSAWQIPTSASERKDRTTRKPRVMRLCQSTPAQDRAGASPAAAGGEGLEETGELDTG
jgi:hypothetical protein